MGIEEIKNKLIKRSMANWERQVKENAMESYEHIIPLSQNLKKEIYIQAIENRDVRKCFTQFRISAHQLAIERRRYKNLKATERICNFCQAKEVDDEMHFLIKCQKFSFE